MKHVLASRIAVRQWLVSAFAFLFLFALLCHQSTAAQKVPSWQEKDWTKWSSNDCEEVLENSPWVASHSYYDWWGRLQIRSALPIRLALLRQYLIKNGYDRAQGEKRRVLDVHVARTLAEDFGDRILVHYEYGVHRLGEKPLTLTPRGPHGILETSDGREISSIATIDVKKNVSWSSESEEFTLVFPRVVNGAPVIRSQAVVFVVLIGKRTGNEFSLDLRRRFRLDHMEYNGKVEF